MQTSSSTIHPGYIPQTSQYEAQFVSRVLGGHRTVSLYKDLVLQATALSLIPDEELRQQAQRNYENQQQDESTVNKHTIDHFVMRELLHWFKHKFFKWVNQPACSSCGAATKLVGRAEPNAYEKQGLAGVVEVYQCDGCRQYTRFARYNHAGRLLETREGRCGEWAQCFTLICIAMGFTARFVNDWTDHVWTEVFIEGRWQHADSCEASLDAPLMYESGWGKKLNMVVAAGFDDIVDVTRRYSRKFYTDEFQQRRRALGVSEDFVHSAILNMNTQLQIFMDPQKVLEVKFKMDQEQEELRQTQKEAVVATKEEELRGRQSGSTEWKESRGETGDALSKKRALCITPPSGVNHNVFENEIIKNNLLYSQDHITLVGHAGEFSENDNPFIRLTPNKTSQCGAFWLKDKQHVTQNSLYVSFSFRTVGSGADGFAFVLQNQGPTAIGEHGCGLGYQGLRKSIAIEFDTYASVDHCNDPDGNHISVHTRYTDGNSAHHNYSIACTRDLSSSYGIVLNDNKIHKVNIVYDTSNKKMHLSIDGLWILRDVDVDLSKVFGGDNETCWLGFTASTGGLCEAHDILSLNLLQQESALPTKYIVFNAGNVQGIKKKILEVNTTRKDNTLNGMNQSTLTKMINSLESTTAQTQVSWSQAENDVIFKILEHWDISTHFPALDLFRIYVAKYPEQLAAFYTDPQLLLKQVLLDKQQQPFANRMIMYRLLSNLFNSEKTISIVRLFAEQIFDSVFEESSAWTIQKNDKIPSREAYSSLLYNYSIMYHRNSTNLTDDERDSIVRVVSAAVSALKMELQENPIDDKTIDQLILTLLLLAQMGNANPEDNLTIGLILSMDGDTLIKSLLSSQVQETTKEHAQKLNSLLSNQ
jgi:peptide-N4-(N-acetyl-beta-glucosaminyl)asparagine amidase